MKYIPFFFLIFSTLFADNISKLNNLSLGIKFNINFLQAPKDFSLGLEVNSPLLFDTVGLNFEFDYAFLRGSIKTNIIKKEEIFNYYTYKLGIITSTGDKYDRIRPYLKLGYLMVHTPDEVFMKPFYNGIYGGFGININFSNPSFLGIFFETMAIGIFEEIYVDEFTTRQIFASGINFAFGVKTFF
ncbi:MAG: hypothetical protein WHS77_06980 [Brevinematales bacterium]